MRADRVMDELGAALERIDDLRVYPYVPDRVVPPAAVVGWPEVTYDATMRRGSDTYALTVWVLVGKADARSARDALAPYLDGAGTSSVKAAIRAGTYAACDSVRVASARVEPISIADIPYLAAIFDVEVTGTGGNP